MAWTYGNDPVSDGTAAQLRDSVRFLSQTNIDATATPVTDEEIAFAIAEEANVYMAAAAVALIMAGRAGGISSRKVGALTISYGSQHYRDLARDLRGRGSAHQTLFAGGTSIASKDTHLDNEDLEQPRFKRGLHDHPEGG